jgi:hypothetical protein
MTVRAHWVLVYTAAKNRKEGLGVATPVSRTRTYMDKLVRLIPAEWVSAYLTIKGILDSTTSDVRMVYWLVIVILLILLPFYLWRVLAIKSKTQIAVTTTSFVVWVFSLGGDHVGAFSWYEPYQGSITLILWTLVAAVFISRYGRNSRPRRSETTKP